MDVFRELLACPACAGTLGADWSCHGCGIRFEAPDGIPNLLLPSDPRTDAVRRRERNRRNPVAEVHDVIARLGRQAAQLREGVERYPERCRHRRARFR